MEQDPQVPGDARRGQNSEQPGVCDAPAAASAAWARPVRRVDGDQTSERKTKGFVSTPAGQGAKRKRSRVLTWPGRSHAPATLEPAQHSEDPLWSQCSRRLMRSAAAPRKRIRGVPGCWQTRGTCHTWCSVQGTEETFSNNLTLHHCYFFELRLQSQSQCPGRTPACAPTRLVRQLTSELRAYQSQKQERPFPFHSCLQNEPNNGRQKILNSIIITEMQINMRCLLFSPVKGGVSCCETSRGGCQQRQWYKLWKANSIHLPVSIKLYRAQPPPVNLQKKFYSIYPYLLHMYCLFFHSN